MQDFLIFVAACRVFFFFFNCGMRDLLIAAWAIWCPDQGSNPGPLQWELGVLATGLPGKSLVRAFLDGVVGKGLRKVIFQEKLERCEETRHVRTWA